MTDSLIIRLPDVEGAAASWVIYDAAAGRVGMPQTGPLALAAALATNRRVIALAPGVEVLLAEPELPVRGGARLAQVVPFALEEQLATDVETLHFAIGRRGADRRGTPVAVTTREHMAQWLEYLRSAQINPDALYIDSTALPANPGQSVLLIEGDRLFVRHPGELPVVLDAQPLPEALELANVFVESAPRSVVAYLSQADWHSHQASLDAARARLANIKVQLLPQGALPLLASEVVSHPPINLLQGSYAPTTRSAVQWRNWRVAAILLAALIGLNLVGKAIDIWRLGKEERALDAALTQVFREAMPGEQNAIDARRRMEARLATIRGTSGPGGANLLDVLSGLAQAFQQVPGATLEALSYRGNVLDLKVAAKDVSALDSLQNLAAQRGLQAELQSSDTRADGVEGRIQIRARGSS